MSVIGRSIGRRAAAAFCAFMLVGALAPIASAQDEPAFVFPCADGFEWEAAPDQPIQLFCGWGVSGGRGLIEMYLLAHEGTLVIEDEDGNAVLSFGAAEFATLWGDPESGPSGFDDVTCASPSGWGVGWSYLIASGLPEGTYAITWDESLSHPVTDGLQTCRFLDGTRLVEPPNHLVSGGATAVGTIIVSD